MRHHDGVFVMYLILMRSLIDGKWEVVPDQEGRDRATPFKHLANARHTYDVLMDRDPRHERCIVQLVDLQGRGEVFHE